MGAVQSRICAAMDLVRFKTTEIETDDKKKKKKKPKGSEGQNKYWLMTLVLCVHVWAVEMAAAALILVAEAILR